MIRYNFIFLVQLFKALTFTRLWNLIRLRFYFILSTFFKFHKTNLHPSFISIEPTNICNLHCPECPTGNGSSIVDKGKISLQTVQKLIPQISSKTIFVNLYFQGEPFIHESIIQIISSINKARMLTSISSNAHFINTHTAHEIVKSGLTKIIISLDGYNQETYELYRRNGKFQKVIDSVQAISNAKKELHSATPLIELQCLLFKHTQHHKNEIREIGKKYGANITVFKTAQFYSEENIAMLPDKKNSRYSIDNNSLVKLKPSKNRCWKMWSSSVVSWQGNVLPCCFDKNHTYSYGNVDNQTFQSILDSKTTRNFKQQVQTNRNVFDICKNCTE